MTATATQSDPTRLNVLGRYTLAEEARILVGRRIEGKVYLYDYPRDGRGRRYFVEAGFESKAELAVLLADYRRQARRLGACPMSREAIERTFTTASAEPNLDRTGAPSESVGARSGCSDLNPPPEEPRRNGLAISTSPEPEAAR